MLYIVATPIGNLKDITLRAIETLKSVDLIACEDTRQTRKLTSRYDIGKPLTSYFEHNKFSKGPYLIGLLKQGKDIALVSDSGTPGISDPGFYLSRLAIQEGIPVTAIPGPTALIMALILSGKPTDRFVFEGYLPAKSGARKKKLQALAKESRTILIYEAPHRLLKTLHDILDILGDREIACARELTKKFEEVKRGGASELIEYFTNTPPRGEFVLVL